MRILAVDAGNTRIKWGLHEAEGWLVQGSLPTARAAQLAAAWARLPRPQQVLAANVAGARAARAIRAAARSRGLAARFVRSAAAQCGVRSAYERPARLGPDRWAALIGAWHLYRRACLVVSAGTALTADALTAEGLFLGGIIVPGPELMRRALARGTAALPARRGRFAFFPVRTEDAIASGTLDALAGAVERMRRFLREAGHSEPLTVVSGGAAQLIAAQLGGAVEVVDNLVLEGIVRIARERRGRARAS